MNRKIYRDFAVTRFDLLETIREAGRALDPSEDELDDFDIRSLMKRLEVAYGILSYTALDNYTGDAFHITYRLPHHPDYDNPYVCNDYDDLLRCMKLEQEGKVTITSINGIEWDKEDYDYYFSEKGATA